MTDEKMLREDEAMSKETALDMENAQTFEKDCAQSADMTPDSAQNAEAKEKSDIDTGETSGYNAHGGKKDNKDKKDKKEKRQMSEVTKCSLVLVVIAVIAGLLLGIVNWATYVDPDSAIMEKCKAFVWAFARGNRIEPIA